MAVAKGRGGARGTDDGSGRPAIGRRPRDGRGTSVAEQCLQGAPRGCRGGSGAASRGEGRMTPDDRATGVGAPLARLDGPAKVTGRAAYAGDEAPAGTLHGVLVTSSIP